MEPHGGQTSQREGVAGTVRSHISEHFSPEFGKPKVAGFAVFARRVAFVRKRTVKQLDRDQRYYGSEVTVKCGLKVLIGLEGSERWIWKRENYYFRAPQRNMWRRAPTLVDNFAIEWKALAWRFAWHAHCITCRWYWRWSRFKNNSMASFCWCPFHPQFILSKGWQFRTSWDIFAPFQFWFSDSLNMIWSLLLDLVGLFFEPVLLSVGRLAQDQHVRSRPSRGLWQMQQHHPIPATAGPVAWVVDLYSIRSRSLFGSAISKCFVSLMFISCQREIEKPSYCHLFYIQEVVTMLYLRWYEIWVRISAQIEGFHWYSKIYHHHTYFKAVQRYTGTVTLIAQLMVEISSLSSIRNSCKKLWIRSCLAILDVTYKRTLYQRSFDLAQLFFDMIKCYSWCHMSSHDLWDIILQECFQQGLLPRLAATLTLYCFQFLTPSQGTVLNISENISRFLAAVCVQRFSVRLERGSATVTSSWVPISSSLGYGVGRMNEVTWAPVSTSAERRPRCSCGWKE